MSGYRTCKSSKVGRRNSIRTPGCAAAGDEDCHNRMTQAYIRDVVKRFKHQPSVYKQFVHIMSDIKQPAVDKIDIITRVAILFHHHRDLIMRFNRFLPPGYAFDIQDDAVVVKVVDSLGSVDEPHRHSEFWLAEGHKPTSRDTRRLTQTTLKEVRQKGIRETLKYVAKVKEASTVRVYRQFLDALADFHEHRIGELETIQRIVALFQMRAPLVEGFNRFLPDGFAVRKEGESGYMITYPAGASNRPETLHYMVDEAFT